MVLAQYTPSGTLIVADEVDQLTEREAAYPPLVGGRPVGPKPNGRCHWCDMPLIVMPLFCDTECRDDFERHDRAMHITGGRT